MREITNYEFGQEVGMNSHPITTPNIDWGKHCTKENAVLSVALIFFVILGTMDTVLYIRLAHKMDKYVWFLSQIVTSVGFCCISWPVVWFKMFYTKGITKEMREFPHHAFCAIALLDSLASLLLTIPSPYVPGPVIGILAQSRIPLTMIMSWVFLHIRYRPIHYIGAFVIIIGVFINTIPFFTAKGDEEVNASIAFWAVLVIVHTIPAAGSNVYKEKGLKEGAGGEIDVWYFNAWVAIYQFAWGLLNFYVIMIPLPEPAVHVNPQDIPNYLVGATECFFGINKDFPECDNAWIVYSVYILFNVMVNVLMLYLFQKGSAVLAIVTSTASLILVNLTFHVPLIAGEALESRFSPYNLLALAMIAVGIIIYRLRAERRKDKEEELFIPGYQDDEPAEGYELFEIPPYSDSSAPVRGEHTKDTTK